MAERERPIRLLITGGGTGGHLFPAVAAAQALQARLFESEVLFVGTRRKIDTQSLERYGFKHCSITSYGLKGTTATELVKALAILPLSFSQAIARIRAFAPDVALGVGGYVTGPVMAAARFLGVPTVIHEQNSVPGMANRKLGRLVDRVCVSLPGSESYFPAEKTVLTGNPVRTNILQLAQAVERQHGARLTLLVLGGSQGAHAVNDLVAGAFCGESRELVKDLDIIHQTGKSDYDTIAARYKQAGLQARVAPFFEDMAEVYGQADLLVSRAGATTLTELAVLGKPAILIPYPYAADNHQKKNGDYYVQGGGAIMYEEKEITSQVLAQAIATLAGYRDRLTGMSRKMRALGMPDAAEKIVDICLEAAKRR